MSDREACRKMSLELTFPGHLVWYLGSHIHLAKQHLQRFTHEIRKTFFVHWITFALFVCCLMVKACCWMLHIFNALFLANGNEMVDKNGQFQMFGKIQWIYQVTCNSNWHNFYIVTLLYLSLSLCPIQTHKSSSTTFDGEFFDITTSSVILCNDYIVTNFILLHHAQSTPK